MKNVIEFTIKVEMNGTFTHEDELDAFRSFLMEYAKEGVDLCLQGSEFNGEWEVEAS